MSVAPGRRLVAPPSRLVAPPHQVRRALREGGLAAARLGIGLSNTRARLTRLYGADCELEVSNAPDGGLEARIVLPFRLAHAEWQGET